ncbi:hypothetical protein [Amycolatopsis thermoflava]|uniref:hypothetical protein n=1 Tax=Amycolatopsis thermoflava TaxID=84480 RepID=UPI0004088000|nr:hypothetical protein [Amycolatopsis thermoflava]
MGTRSSPRKREAIRRQTLQRKVELDAERRRRDELEVEFATDFQVALVDRAAARDAERAAEVAMGGAVDRLIGQLRLSYDRVAELCQAEVKELQRLRQLAAETARPVVGRPATPASPVSPRVEGAPAGEGRGA